MTFNFSHLPLSRIVMGGAILQTVLLTLGCGGSNPSTLVPVEGIVTFEGKPLTSGAIITTCESASGARATIDSEGRFALSTPNVGVGAEPGTHRVVVTSYQNSEAQKMNPEAELVLAIPKRYTDAETSGLTIDVQPPGRLDMKVELTKQP